MPERGARASNLTTDGLVTGTPLAQRPPFVGVPVGASGAGRSDGIEPTGVLRVRLHQGEWADPNGHRS